MEVDFHLLQTLHRILRQENDLTERMRKGPRRIKLAENAQAEIQTELEQAEQVKTETKKNVHSKQQQLDEREAKIEKLSAQRNGCGNNREFQLLGEQIEADKQANGVLEDEILELMERIDEMASQIEVIRNRLNQAENESARVRNEVEQSGSQLKNELDRVHAERLDNEKTLPIELKSEYKRLVENNGESGLAQVDDGTCGNCFSILPPRLVDTLRQAKVCYCFSCGALMYLSEKVSST